MTFTFQCLLTSTQISQMLYWLGLVGLVYLALVLGVLWWAVGEILWREHKK